MLPEIRKPWPPAKLRITCHAKCGNFRSVDWTSSVGAILDATGYHCAFVVDDIVYYCPECFEKAQSLAYVLLGVVKDRDIRLRDFLDRDPSRSKDQTIVLY